MNPWKASYGSYVAVEDRLNRIREMSLGQLRLALDDPSTQKTVAKAIRVRIRKLMREVKK